MAELSILEKSGGLGITGRFNYYQPLTDVIVGDIAGYDELVTNKLREAIYYGGFGFRENRVGNIHIFQNCKFGCGSKESIF